MKQDIAFVDFRNLSLPQKPNWFLSLPESGSFKSKNAADGPSFDVPVEQLKEHLQRLLGDEPRLTVHLASDDGLKYEVIVRTAVLRFPDRVSIEIVSLGEKKSGVALFSRSIYGYSDFGANRKRGLNWLQRLSRSIQRG